jgi:hypothetical protein
MDAFDLSPEEVSIRVAIVNFRTREDDLRSLLQEADRAGKEIV